MSTRSYFPCAVVCTPVTKALDSTFTKCSDIVSLVGILGQCCCHVATQCRVCSHTLVQVYAHFNVCVKVDTVPSTIKCSTSIHPRVPCCYETLHCYLYSKLICPNTSILRASIHCTCFQSVFEYEFVTFLK